MADEAGRGGRGVTCGTAAAAALLFPVVPAVPMVNIWIRFCPTFRVSAKASRPAAHWFSVAAANRLQCNQARLIVSHLVFSAGETRQATFTIGKCLCTRRSRQKKIVAPDDCGN